MTLLDREVIPANISTKGIIYSSFLLLLVISLFFIPEIVKFQESLTKAKSPPPLIGTPLNSVNIDEIIPSSPHPGSLDKIWSMVNGGFLEKKKADGSIPAPGANGSTKDGSDLLDAALGTAGTNVKEIQDRAFLEHTLSGQQVTWDQINSAEVRRAFRSAQSGATKILKGLSERQSAVRFSLVNYINGLGWIIRGDRKLMSADEALAYMEQLDINVTQAMLTSEIDAHDFEQWKRISFGPLSANSRASAFKMNRYVTFNPRLTLEDVEIQKSPDYKLRGDGTYSVNAPRSSLKLTGFVMGKDVKTIIVYRNGRRAADVRVSSRDNEDGLRIFKWRYKTADGLFTFRANSKEGDVFEKSYVFLPKVNRRFRQDEDGYFLLPFGGSSVDSVSLRSLDSRLDRFFRVRVRGGSDDSNAGFDTF